MKKYKFEIPYLIEQYNTYMKGVDYMDKYISLYMNKHRSLKWYKKIIIYLIEIAINNANIIYNVYAEIHNLNKINALNFHLFLLGIKPYDLDQNKILERNDIKEYRDPNQPKIDIFFRTINILNNNNNDNLVLCFLESMKKRDICYICAKLGIKGDNRTKTGCKKHNKFICSKYPNHLTVHICEYYNIIPK
jgi:hypothetical protein